MKKYGTVNFGNPEWQYCEWCGEDFYGPPAAFCTDVCHGQVRCFLMWFAYGTVKRPLIYWADIRSCWNTLMRS